MSGEDADAEHALKSEERDLESIREIGVVSVRDIRWAL